VKSALIIIDMQQALFTDETPKYDSFGVVSRLNKLARGVRESGGTVIFVQHDGQEGDPLHPASPGWQLLSNLDVEPDDIRVRKSSCDAFLGTNLDDVLRQFDQIIVTGCATDYCVDTTVRSALAKGYRTIVPEDGHTTSNRPHLSAEKIIEHHNAIWANFIAPNGPATVCQCFAIKL
jgi:nicotinamidase-related amidase